MDLIQQRVGALEIAGHVDRGVNHAAFEICQGRLARKALDLDVPDRVEGEAGLVALAGRIAFEDVEVGRAVGAVMAGVCRPGPCRERLWSAYRRATLLPAGPLTRSRAHPPNNCPKS